MLFFLPNPFFPEKQQQISILINTNKKVLQDEELSPCSENWFHLIYKEMFLKGFFV